MNLAPRNRLRRQHKRGLTLMETVIAVGIIAFTVPLILATTSNSAKTRRNAEADTRSAWIATDVHRMLSESWRGINHEAFTPAPAFPTFGSQADPLVFHYNNDGRFLKMGSSADLQTPTQVPGSVYLVTLQGIGRDPHNFLNGNAQQLSEVTVDVHFPSQAPQGKRHISSYNVMIPRQNQP